MKFKVKPHSVLPGVEVVEVFDDKGNFIATVTAGDSDQEIRVISHFFEASRVEFEGTPLPAVRVYLHPPE